jgi:molybdopterin/thiamine biosynthesis adenylyltransferase
MMNPNRKIARLDRYHRQMLLSGFGPDGQQKLLDSTALILGCGALGTVSANMLARAGVGHLIIVDRDFIDLTNLQRQVLFDEADIAAGLPKAEAAKRKIGQINSQVRVTAVVDDINYRNISALAENADILIDGLDNFETRYLANDYAVKSGKPYMYGGAVGTTGMAYAILPHSPDGNLPWESLAGDNHATPCFRCLFEQAPAGESPTCDTIGVLGPAVSIIANFQAAEALKILTGNFMQVNTKLLNIDLWSNVLMQLDVSDSWDVVQLLPAAGAAGINLPNLQNRLQGLAETSRNEFMLRVKLQDAGKEFEISMFVDGRAIIRGTDDIAEARGIYAKYIGI